MTNDNQDDAKAVRYYNMAMKQPDISASTASQAEKRQVRHTGKSGQPAANDGIQYRAYPDQKQYEAIAKTIGSCRYYWNLIIDIAQITKEQCKRSLTIQPAEAKKFDEWSFLKEVDSLALASVFMNYQQAWENHKNNLKHFQRPTWKKRHGLEGSYTTYNQPKWDAEKEEYISSGSIRIQDGKIRLPKIGWVKIREHMELPQDSVIKSVTVRRDCAGRVFVSINYYNPELAAIMEQAGLDTSKDRLVITGLDYSNPRLFVNESGLSPTDVHFYKQSEAKLAKLQRKLARRVPGSANYKKLQQRIARLHRRIANQRKDLLHKLSHELATKCDVVVVESLDMKAMGKRKSGGKYSFGKSVSDNAWGTFLTYLDYKLQRHHGQLVKIDKWFPSSKTCHHCGAVNDTLGLSDRSWECPECGHVHDRDVNAAWNILLEGVRMLRAGEVAGVGISDAVKFYCAGGMPVTAATEALPVDGGVGCGVLPVEACKTDGGALRYCSRNTGLRNGNAELREAGIKDVATSDSSLVATEAPTSATR